MNGRGASRFPLVECGKYEGGLSRWECARDLVEYLKSQAGLTSTVVGKLINKHSTPLTVLELGCGRAAEGAFTICHLRNAERDNITNTNIHTKGSKARGEGDIKEDVFTTRLILQDLNEQVFDEIVVPEFQSAKIGMLRCRWSDMIEDVSEPEKAGHRETNSLEEAGRQDMAKEDGKDKSDFVSTAEVRQMMFDLILCSECIYREENFDDLVEILDRYLSYDDDACFLHPKHTTLAWGVDPGHSYSSYQRQNSRPSQ